MKKWLKHWTVRFCWWLFSPLGATVNGILGGPEQTGLEGTYEQLKPDKVEPGIKWWMRVNNDKDIKKGKFDFLFVPFVYIKSIIGFLLMFTIILVCLPFVK